MQVKSQTEIIAMREGGRMLATVLNLLAKALETDGMITKDLAALASQELKRLGGEPAFWGYQGFPDVICISVNDEVVHGIPGSRRIKNGDIVGLDFGVKYKSLITDAAISVIAGGKGDSDSIRLVEATKESLGLGIAQVKNGAQIGDISAAIEGRLRADGLGVIEVLVGHGVGKHLHEPPEVPNFGKIGQGPHLKNGQTIAVEPMATLGGKRDVYLEKDGWMIRTLDGSLSAHFEHTVLVTDDGAEILTQL